MLLVVSETKDVGSNANAAPQHDHVVVNEAQSASAARREDGCNGMARLLLMINSIIAICHVVATQAKSMQSNNSSKSRI